MKAHKQPRITLSIFRMSYVLTLIALLAVGSNVVWGNPPRLLNYQGKLTDTTSGQPVAGTVSITFSIYDTPTDGLPLWTEPHGNVIVTGGLFNVILGGTTPIPDSVLNGGDRFFELTVNGQPITPRQQIVSVLFAVKAQDAETVGGRSASDFALVTHPHSASDITSGTLSEDRLPQNAIDSSEIENDSIKNEDIFNTANISPSKISGTAWTSTNDGSGSGLDADMLDGLHASSFLSTSDDYGRQGVASNLYEGSTRLQDKYLNDDQPETISATSSAQTLRVENNGSGHGIYSKTNSSVDEKAAVYGESMGTSGNTKGVVGITKSPGSSTGSSVGVYGWAQSSTAIGGSTMGVLGRTWSVPEPGADTSVGVFGWGDVSSGRTYGIWGETRSSTDNVSGVYGVNTASSGMTRGVIGVVNSTTSGAVGVLGSAPNTGAVRAVMGYSHSPNGYAVYSDGNFAVAPGYTATADAWTTRSSKRWKTHIKPIEGAREKVQHLRGVSFDWKADGRHDIGLIAEEVGKVIPEVVAYEENGKDAKSIDYARLVAVLIEAVKEQQEIIDKQNSELTEMKAKMTKFESVLQKLDALTATLENFDGRNDRD